MSRWEQTRNILMAGSAGMTIMSDAKREVATSSVLIDDLKEHADKIGFDPEIKELMEKVDSLSNDIKKKNFELMLLEVIAMESYDDNVKDLREQLFTAVKLIHSEDIEELMKNDYIKSQFFSDNQQGHIRFDTETSPDTDISKHEFHNNIVHRIGRYVSRNIELRKATKEFKKTWKHTKNPMSSIEDYFFTKK